MFGDQEKGAGERSECSARKGKKVREKACKITRNGLAQGRQYRRQARRAGREARDLEGLRPSQRNSRAMKKRGGVASAGGERHGKGKSIFRRRRERESPIIFLQGSGTVRESSVRLGARRKPEKFGGKAEGSTHQSHSRGKKLKGGEENVSGQHKPWKTSSGKESFACVRKGGGELEGSFMRWEKEKKHTPLGKKAVVERSIAKLRCQIRKKARRQQKKAGEVLRKKKESKCCRFPEGKSKSILEKRMPGMWCHAHAKSPGDDEKR